MDVCVAVEAMNLGLKYEMGRNYFLKQVRSRVMKQTHGVYPAPLKIIDVCCSFHVIQNFLTHIEVYYIIYDAI